jgi:hypothetical protein
MKDLMGDVKRNLRVTGLVANATLGYYNLGFFWIVFDL